MHLPSRSTGIVVAICAALAASSSSAAAQATPPAKHEHAAVPMEHHLGGWKEMDAFHALMMQTWHPASESNDLAPVRARARSMATAAAAWAKAPVPAACDTRATRQTIAALAADSRALASLVRSKSSDTRVKTALAALHDRFETVERGCKPGASHHD